MGDAILSYKDFSDGNTGPLAKGVDTSVYTTAIRPGLSLGMVAWGEDGKAYRYVKFVDAVTYAAGQVLTFASATTWDVTNDRAGGSAIAGHGVAGVCLGVPAQNEYGWIQIAGLVAVNGTYSAGDFLKPHATSNGDAVVSGYTAAKADFNIFAYALSSSLVKLIGVL